MTIYIITWGGMKCLIWELNKALLINLLKLDKSTVSKTAEDLYICHNNNDNHYY